MVWHAYKVCMKVDSWLGSLIVYSSTLVASLKTAFATVCLLLFIILSTLYGYGANFGTGKMDFFATGLPWLAIDQSIDIVTFDYEATDQAMRNFESSTGLRWNNLEDSLQKSLMCPHCATTVTVPWTEGSQWSSGSNEMTSGNGYADGSFETHCTDCKTRINHDYLRAQKFNTDMRMYLRSDLPMPGTVFSADGKPSDISSLGASGIFNFFPNRLISGGLNKTLEPILLNPEATLEDVKAVVEKAVADRK